MYSCVASLMSLHLTAVGRSDSVILFMEEIFLNHLSIKTMCARLFLVRIHMDRPCFYNLTPFLKKILPVLRTIICHFEAWLLIFLIGAVIAG